MLSKVVGDGGVCWDLCSGVVALGGALSPGAEHRAHLGLPRSSVPCLLQGKDNQNSEAELFYALICNFSLVLFFAQSKEQAA